MGWLGITRGLGEVGSDIAGGAEQLREERRQEVQDRAEQMERQLRAIQTRAQLANLYQGMRQANVPQAVGKPVQGADGKWRQLVRDPNTGKMDVQELKGYGELTPEEQGVMNAERVLGRKLTDEEKQRYFRIAPPASVQKGGEFEEWREQFKNSHGRYPNDAEIERWHRQPKAAGESATADDIDSYVEDLHQTRKITDIPSKLRGQVLTAYRSKYGAPPRPSTAEEERRADLAENVNENLDQLEEIVKRRPELFGKLGGAKTWIAMHTFTTDPDISSLRDIRDNLGRAAQGAHGMRAARGVEDAATAVIGHFLDDPRAILSSSATARRSVKTFLRDVGREENEGREPVGGNGNSADPLEDIIQRALKPAPKPSAGKK